MNELREKIEHIKKEHLIYLDKESAKTIVYHLDELTSLVDKPQVSLNETNNTLEGKSITEGHKGSEVTQTPNLREVKRKFYDMMEKQFHKDFRFIVGDYGELETNTNDIDNFFVRVTESREFGKLVLSLLATKEHDDKIREEAVKEYSKWIDDNTNATYIDGGKKVNLYKMWGEEYLKSLSGDTK